MRTRRQRALPPIINFGKFRIDFPSRERSFKDNLKFAGFVVVLLLIFLLLYQVQANWLTARNAREAAPDLRTLAVP
ncbi:MAG TPA: hypothetical protein PKE12_15670 [Kiritimatiellia bacterium]|nr:hypothetical protein [Kiritimatiellia bacterium]